MNAEPNMVLDTGACWDYLRSTTVGCLAVSVEGRPDIFPINYAVEHSALVFRTSQGAKVEAIEANPHVAFEIDGFEPETGTAWSIVVKGTVKAINDADELLDTLALDVEPWQPGPKNRFFRILAEEVSGRRFTVAESAYWETSLSRTSRAPRE